ncbi:hypothetical protein [Anaerosporobacter sp.]|uniref:hypothetical protein n=1 Tax=Anaerosporobacter sp. TaxID=1872529 RepID=UPI00286F91C8|nr:hypothetical protein [Anaerosporobacter sp.]
MYFNSNETYREAIENEDKGVIRALLVGIIGADPTFATNEYEEARGYIKEQSKKLHGNELIIDEQYKLQEDEYVKNEDEWDESYYQMQLVWLRDNFAIDTRLSKIKEIGKVVYKNRMTMGKTKAQRRKLNGNSSTGTINDITQKKEPVVMTTSNDKSDIWLFSKTWWAKYWWLLVIGVAVIYMVCNFFFRKILEKKEES